MLSHLKLRHKLLLFWLGSVIASLLVLGAMFHLLITDLHENGAQRQIDLAFQTLHNSIKDRTERLLKTGQYLAQRADIVASVNMLYKYQDTAHYEPRIFDVEKEKLARELSERGHIDELDALIVYDGNNRLSSFMVREDNKQQRTGYASYHQGQELILLSEPEEGLYEEATALPALIESGHPLAIRSTPYSHLHAEQGRLLLEVYFPVLRRQADGSLSPIGLIKVIDILGEDFAQTVTQRTRLEFMLAPTPDVTIGSLSHIDFQLWPDSATADTEATGKETWRWIGHPDYFLGTERYPVDGGGVWFAFGIEKTQLEGALQAFQQSMLLVLVLGGALFIPMGAYALNRSVAEPVSILVSRIEDIKQGRYRQHKRSSRSDELGYLLDAFNDMAQTVRVRETELSKLSLAVEQSPASVMITDTDGAIEYANPRFTQVTGYSLEEVRGMNPRLLKSDNTPTEIFDDLWETITTGRVWRGVLENIKKNGESYWESVSISPIKDPGGAITHFVAVKEDITERRQAEAERMRFRLALDSSGDCIFLIDPEAMRFVDFNETVLDCMRYTRAELLAMGPQHITPHYDQETLQDLFRQIIQRSDHHGELASFHRRKDGTEFPVEIRLSALEQESGHWLIIALSRDISERKQAEWQIEHQAHYDALTDLPNRRLLLERLEQELTRAHHRKRLGALLYVDLDHFKMINDSLGHKVGDALVQHVAQCLRNICYEGDTVARLGGDEFAILLTELGASSDQEAALKEIQRMLEATQAALASPCRIDQHQLHITASIGITLFPDNGESADDILRQADIAMSRAKEQGRNNFQFYMPSMQQAVTERHTLEKDLRQALQEGQLELFFQPQISRENKLIGAECLLRWQHPEQGMVSPARFIPVAEDSGLILDVGHWVLQRACTQLKHWQSDPHGPALKRLAVNISPKQFYQADFVAQVRDILIQTGADPSTLELELTEGMLISNIEDAIDKMQALQRIGVHFSIDDFGTGYSSLSYLKRLPVDKLKIDQSFVHDITQDSNDAAIVDTIIAMARHLGLEVIAEGVESALQLEFLRERNCDTYQGFYFSRPLPLDEFMRFVERLSV